MYGSAGTEVGNVSINGERMSLLNKKKTKCQKLIKFVRVSLYVTGTLCFIAIIVMTIIAGPKIIKIINIVDDDVIKISNIVGKVDNISNKLNTFINNDFSNIVNNVNIVGNSVSSIITIDAPPIIGRVSNITSNVNTFVNNDMPLIISSVNNISVKTNLFVNNTLPNIVQKMNDTQFNINTFITSLQTTVGDIYSKYIILYNNATTFFDESDQFVIDGINVFQNLNDTINIIRHDIESN